MSFGTRWSRLVIVATALLLIGQAIDAPADSPSIEEAAANGDLATVKRIVEQNPSAVSSVDSYRETPLHSAAKNGRLDVVDYLLSHGADPNAQNNAGQTPLCEAALVGHADVAESLLQGKADLRIGFPLETAATLGNIEVARVLLSHGADPNLKDETGTTPLHQSVTPKLDEKTLRAMMELLLSSGATIEATDNSGRTPLHLAAIKGPPDAVTVLLEHHANVDARDASQKTQLHLAMERVWLTKREVASSLLSKHPDINAKDVVGYTPLHILAKMRLGLTAEEVRSGATTSDQKAMELVSDQIQTASLLLANGAGVDARDNSNGTPLHWAAWSDSEGVADVLLRSGADIAARDSFGRTPLHKAAEEGSLEVVILLINRGADVDARDNLGTPLGGAARFGKESVVDYLKGHGASE